METLFVPQEPHAFRPGVDAFRFRPLSFPAKAFQFIEKILSSPSFRTPGRPGMLQSLFEPSCPLAQFPDSGEDFKLSCREHGISLGAIVGSPAFRGDNPTTIAPV